MSVLNRNVLLSNIIQQISSPSCVDAYLKISDAMSLCVSAHKDQNPHSGLPYSTHPLRLFNMANRILKINDTDLLCAILLHDVVEDTDVSPEYIEQNFGPVVLSLVIEVTRPPCEDKSYRRSALIDKAGMFSRDAKIIKFLDRIDNLSSAAKDFGDKKIWYYTDESIDLYSAMAKDYDKDALIHALVCMLGLVIRATIDFCICERKLDVFKQLESKYNSAKIH